MTKDGIQTAMNDVVRAVQQAKTYPGALTEEMLNELRKKYVEGDVSGMVKLLNKRDHQTGKHYQIVRYGDGTCGLTHRKV